MNNPISGIGWSINFAYHKAKEIIANGSSRCVPLTMFICPLIEQFTFALA